MQSNFAPIGQTHHSHSGENSFWPSFTDIMMVITMIFLMATSLLVVRNWQLVAELRESIAAEQLASRMIESTSQENATLEERLANAEQSNSILRLRVLQKDEALNLANTALRDKDQKIAALQADQQSLSAALQQAEARFETASIEIENQRAAQQRLANQVAALNQQLNQQKLESQAARAELAEARTQLAETRTQIATLEQTSQSQQQSISSLDAERNELNQDIAAYNAELLALKGDYEVIQSKYQELIKPARSARGKYIAEVYYIKGNNGEIIRYRQPGDSGFTDLPLAEVEKRLSRLKADKGKELYVKIIIPENSGLTYNEAWSFMRNLLVKYDYYYQ